MRSAGCCLRGAKCELQDAGVNFAVQKDWE